MSEGQSQRSVASSAQHRKEAEVAAAEEHERAVIEIAAMAGRVARVTMAELAAARAEVEAATAAELEALRDSSTSSSVSTDIGTDDELKLAREAVREQAAQWAAAHNQGCGGDSLDGHGRVGGAPGWGTRRLCPRWRRQSRQARTRRRLGRRRSRTGTMLTAGSRPLSRMSVPAVGGLPSPRPTTSSGSR
jgi:hypothetical protein